MKKIISKNAKDFSFLPFGTSPSWKWRISSQRWTIYKVNSMDSLQHFWLSWSRISKKTAWGLNVSSGFALSQFQQLYHRVTPEFFSVLTQEIFWIGRNPQEPSSPSLMWMAFCGHRDYRGGGFDLTLWNFVLMWAGWRRAFNHKIIMQNDTHLRSEACQESYWLH